ncbi:MAG: peptidylprolyl isomerase [Bdellovibrionales bacterium]|nr:peptidylprolyl isomerase [Bdellovibrionales bacterium]
MRKLKFCLLFVFAYASFAQAQVIVATVGSKKITLKEFNNKYNEVKKNTINAPEPEVFLEDLIRYEMGLQEAKKKNLEKDPIVQERFNQELYKALLEKQIGNEVAKIQVNEKEMRAYYTKNPEVRLSHILVEFKPDASEKEKAEAKKRALELYEEVKKSKRPFEDLVKLYSDDSLSKNTGGDIQYQSRVTIVPPIYEAALKMNIGSIKGLIETQYGYHIIKLTGKRSYQQANKRQIRAAVFDMKRKHIFDKYFNGLSKKYSVKRNTQALKSVK